MTGNESIDVTTAVEQVDVSRRIHVELVLRALTSSGCSLERPDGARGDYVNLLAPGSEHSRIAAIARKTGRIQFQSDSWDVAVLIGADRRFDRLAAGSKAAITIQSREDALATIAVAQAYVWDRQGQATSHGAASTAGDNPPTSHAYLATLSARDSDNWDLCKRHGLWGVGNSSHALHALKALGVDDQIYVWRSGAGLIAAARCTSPPKRVQSLDDVPWPDPERYTYTFGIEIVEELEQPSPDRFVKHRSQRFGIRTHEVQAGFIGIPPAVAARISEVFASAADEKLGRSGRHRAGRSPRSSKRDAAIVEAWASGQTLAQIATTFGISRQRVSQIRRDMGAPSAKERRRKLPAGPPDTDRLIQSMRDEVNRDPGVSFNELASRLGISTREVRHLLPPDVRSRVIGHSDAPHARRWTDDKVFAALQQAATFAFPLTVGAYRGLVASGEVEGPSAVLVGKRYGGWANACGLAGVECGTTAYKHQSEWTDQDLLSFVQEFLDSPGSDGTIAGYKTWRKAEKPEAPSQGTIRGRFGSWAASKRAALKLSSAHAPGGEEE